MSNFVPNIDLDNLRRGHKINMFGCSRRGLDISFGIFGIKVVSSGNLTLTHFITLQRFLSKALKKKCEYWFRCMPQFKKCQKPSGTRMGGGKGKPSFWYFPIKKGKILIELGDGVSDTFARNILQVCGSKIPMNFRIIKKDI